MAIDPSQLAGTISELIKNLPFILQATQIVTYIFLVLFFGSIAVTGCRGMIPFWKNLLFRVVFGFLSLVCGISLAGFVPISQGLLRLFQMPMLIAGLISSVVFAAGLYAIHLRIPKSEIIKARIKKLEEKLGKIGEKEPQKQKPLQPVTVAGTLMIVVLLLFALINFRGFPSYSDEIYSFFGFSPEDMQSIGGALGGFEGFSETGACAELLGAIAQNTSALADPGIWETYVNNGLKSQMESEAGAAIQGLQKTELGGETVIIGIVNATSYCIATESEVCYCK